MVTLEEASQFLEHPFFLLLVGAGVTSVLIPWFTKRSEDRRKEREIEVEYKRKELEIKVDIVSKMSEAIGHQLANAHNSIDRRKKTYSDPEMDAYYEDLRKWYGDINIIASKLKSYFPETDIGIRWEFYCNLLVSYSKASQVYFYEPPSEAQKNDLKSNLENMKLYFLTPQIHPKPAKIEIERIIPDWDRFTAEITYNEDLWKGVSHQIAKLGEQIIKEVSKLPVKIF